ncbi:Mitochondrial Peptide Methionine Sulfoxide Reductase [Manis pentadactyla]|nr:Mitochondrial Peptide Methionine Sulfoxide Reductase [Manis pentadactyla]
MSTRGRQINIEEPMLEIQKKKSTCCGVAERKEKRQQINPIDTAELLLGDRTVRGGRAVLKNSSWKNHMKKWWLRSQIRSGYVWISYGYTAGLSWKICSECSIFQCDDRSPPQI